MYNISDGSAAWLLSQWNNFLEDTSEFDEYFLAEADKDDNIDNDVKTITRMWVKRNLVTDDLVISLK